MCQRERNTMNDNRSCSSGSSSSSRQIIVLSSHTGIVYTCSCINIKYHRYQKGHSSAINHSGLAAWKMTLHSFIVGCSDSHVMILREGRDDELCQHMSCIINGIITVHPKVDAMYVIVTTLNDKSIDGEESEESRMFI